MYVRRGWTQVLPQRTSAIHFFRENEHFQRSVLPTAMRRWVLWRRDKCGFGALHRHFRGELTWKPVWNSKSELSDCPADGPCDRMPSASSTSRSPSLARCGCSIHRRGFWRSLLWSRYSLSQRNIGCTDPNGDIHHFLRAGALWVGQNHRV